MGSSADVDKAVEAASKAFNSFSQTSVEERLAILGKIVEVYQSRYDEIAETISMEMGLLCPLSKAAQAATGLGHFAQAIEILQGFEWEETKGKTLLRKRTYWSCWNDHTMELADKSNFLQGCPSNSCWMHHGSKTY